MKKFEEGLREKAHLSKIRNAKRTVPQQHKGVSRAGLNKGQKVQMLLQMYENKSFNSIPAYKLLKTEGLQQYTRGFIERGYGTNLNRLSDLNEKDKQKLYEDLKVMPGHTVKLDKIINTISQHPLTQNSELYQQSVVTSQNSHANSLTDHTSFRYNPTVKSRRGPSMKSNWDEDLEYKRQFERVFNDDTFLFEDLKKNTCNQKMSEKVLSSNFPSIEPQKKSYTKTRFLPPSSYKQKSNPAEFKKKQATPVISDHKPTIKKMDRTLEPKKQPLRKKNEKNSSALKSQNTINGNQLNSLSTSKLMELDLGVENIKLLSRSFDGGFMSSTVANIDIEELVYAFSGLIESQIHAAPQLTISRPKQHLQSPVEQCAQLSIEDEVGQILRQSYMHPLYQNEPINQQIDNQEQKEFEQDLVESQGEYQQEEPQDNSSQFKTDDLYQSSFIGGESYDFGLSSPLQIFDESSPTDLDYFKPTIDSISNFIKNVVLAAKMEREIPIMAAHYIQKFLQKTNLTLTSLNYKRLLVSTLLLASKIWDDESFESPSFSRTFPEYTTVLLNQMEKQVLKVLDYRLKLDKQQYAEIYFKLRQFAKKNNRSYQNKKLNLKRIRQLQQGLKIPYKTDFPHKKNSF